MEDNNSALHVAVGSPGQKSRLLEQMDITMVQKLAFASAHFQLHDGARILDIGCARGKGGYHLAALNPRLFVTGADYDPAFITEAQATYPLPNLSFVQGDARKLNMGLIRFDAILNSSVMHEIFSFSGYNLRAVEEALQSQLDHLVDGGVILLRDFVMAANPDAMVYLDLPAGVSTGDDPRDMSYPDLLKLYARIANSEKPEALQGFFLEDLGETKDGWHRFYLPRRWADEFIWRKEYRDRFILEAREQYAFWTAEDYRRIPERMGARVLYAAPYDNPWIVKNWHDGQYRLFDEAMAPIPGPPTNFVTLIQKIQPGASIQLREHRAAESAPSYLQLSHFRHAETGDRHDLVRRPGGVYDVIPYSVNSLGRVVVYAKSGYPRPLVNIHARQMSPNIDGKSWSGHMVEPLAIANRDDDSHGAVSTLLTERTAFDQGDILTVADGLTYYTAPADVNERVGSVFVSVTPTHYESPLTGNFSRFSSDGTLRAFDIQDVLRGMQVGMLAEARLEINIYALMRRLGMTPDEWIGDRFTVSDHLVSQTYHVKNLISGHENVFRPIPEGTGAAQVLRSVFVDEAQEDGVRRVLAAQELEFGVPGRIRGRHDMSTNNVTAMPVVRDQQSGEIMIGVQRRDFAAAQSHKDDTALLTLPTFRLPAAVRNKDDVQDFLRQQFPGSCRDEIQPLGESYFPSMGILPDRMFPYIISANAPDACPDCHFVSLRDLFDNLEMLRDANLILAVCRTVHALGLWDEYAAQPAPDSGRPAHNNQAHNKLTL